MKNLKIQHLEVEGVLQMDDVLAREGLVRQQVLQITHLYVQLLHRLSKKTHQTLYNCSSPQVCLSAIMSPLLFVMLFNLHAIPDEFIL